MANKTAFEEAAEMLDAMTGDINGRPFQAVAKALRAEGRELRRLRDAVFNWKFGTFDEVGEACKIMDREAARIQKSGKGRKR